MARKKEIAQRIEKASPETGELLTFAQEDLVLLELTKREIRNSFLSVAINLKKIRDRKLYLLEDADSMKSWILANFRASYSTANRLLSIADAFDGIPNAEELYSAPLTQLLTLQKDEDTMEALRTGKIELGEGCVILPTGESIPLAEWEKQFAKTNKNTEDKYKHAAQTAKDASKAKDQLLKSQEERLDRALEEVEELKKLIEELSNRKDIDPRKLVILKNKKQAANLIDANTSQMLALVGEIDRIPEDLIDAELAGYIGRSIAALQSAVERSVDHWSPHVYVPKLGTQAPDEEHVS